MNNDSVVSLSNPAEVVKDSLTQFIRESAQAMLRAALEAEVAEFMQPYQASKLPNGQQRLVRNGHLPVRSIQTSVGALQAEVPRVRDRTPDNRIQFQSTLIPKYLRRTATLDVMLPLLYLKGISTGDFVSVLTPMLGEQAKTLTPNVISRLKVDWLLEYDTWRQRDLTGKHYVYFWVDGIYFSARMEHDKTCLLIIIGATEHGKKEVVGFIDGFRESKESWLQLLQDLKERGLVHAPMVAVGDGSLGFWGALQEVYPTTQPQRCWVHKSMNVLDKLPSSQQAKAKSLLHDIYLAETRQEAEKAFTTFIKAYELKYSKATDCLAKDKDVLLTFYNFPAEHWVHLRTTNPIESTFATVRHRTKKSKGCFSRETILASVFKLCLEAEKRWKRLNGKQRCADVINLVKFKDGLPETAVERERKNVLEDAA